MALPYAVRHTMRGAGTGVELQSKQFAAVGIVAGVVTTGLGVVVLLGGLAEAEQPDHDPATGYEDVGTGYIDFDPLPSQPTSKPAGKPSARPPAGSGTGSVDEREGETYVPGEPVPTSAGVPGEPDRPSAPRKTAEPADPGGSTPTSKPTSSAEPEPSPDPTPSDPSSEPTPTETATPTADPQ